MSSGKTTAHPINGTTNDNHLIKNGSHHGLEGDNNLKQQHIYRSYSNAENTDAGNTAIIDDPMVNSGDVNDSGDVTGYSKSPNSKKSEMERLKHRAIRPSARCQWGNGAIVNGVSPPNMNGATNGLIWQPRFMTVKKYSKNSRRTRGRYGRGLPKKGNSPFDVHPLHSLSPFFNRQTFFIPFLFLVYTITLISNH